MSNDELTAMAREFCRLIDLRLSGATNEAARKAMRRIVDRINAENREAFWRAVAVVRGDTDSPCHPSYKPSEKVSMKPTVPVCTACGVNCNAATDYDKRQRDLRSHRRTGLCRACRDKAFDAGTPPACTPTNENGSDEIVCPHCGYSYSPSIPEGGDRVCQVCDGEYEVVVEAIPTYCTRPIPKGG